MKEVQFYKKRNKTKVNYIETWRAFIAYSFP